MSVPSGVTYLRFPSGAWRRIRRELSHTSNPAAMKHQQSQQGLDARHPLPNSRVYLLSHPQADQRLPDNSRSPPFFGTSRRWGHVPVERMLGTGCIGRQRLLAASVDAVGSSSFSPYPSNSLVAHAASSSIPAREATTRNVVSTCSVDTPRSAAMSVKDRILHPPFLKTTAQNWAGRTQAYPREKRPQVTRS